MMDLDILNEESIVKLVSNMSSQLTYKLPFSTKSDHVSKKKEFFRIAFEILLNKRSSNVTDKRSSCQLDLLLMEIQFLILCRNRRHLNPDLRNKIIAKVDRLGELARKDSDHLALVKSILRIVLILNDYLPERRIKGILKYKEPVWFPIVPAERSSFNSDVNDGMIRSMMCIKGSYDSPFFSSNKLKKSATWHEGVVNALTRSTSGSNFHRPSSQTLLSQDEGFVTPDDNHREVTPEPFKHKKLEPGWWCTWDVVGVPPSQYKTWECQWTSPVMRESTDLLDLMKLSYNSKRADCIMMGAHVPPSADHFVPLDQLGTDIVSLLCGLPSSTFHLEEGNRFRLVEGCYTTGIMPNCLPHILSPFIEFGETFRNLETFIENNQCFHQIIPQAFLQSLSSYLYQLKSLLLSSVENASSQERMDILRLFILKPSAHLSYLWNIINVEGNMGCHRILERMHSSLPFINDDQLLCVVNSIFLKCCYIYISLFEKFITRGLCAEELSGGSGLSVEKVPAFLRSLTDMINNSSKTLHLLHEDPKMYLLKNKVMSKKLKADLHKPEQIIDHKELIKQHYIKFMKEKEVEREALASKKAAQLESIKLDIANKQKWKELQDLEQEMRERKLQDRYDKLDAIKQQYIQDCMKEVESKYETLIRESDKKIALANWKLKRLAGENPRSEIIKTDETENKSVRDMFMRNSVDLSEQNLELLVSPVKVSYIEVKVTRSGSEEVDGVEQVESRHEEALEIKKRMLDGDDIWRNFDDEELKTTEKVKDTLEIADGLKIYEENRNRALEIKKKIMSSELELNCIPCLDSPEFNGLSPAERESLEQDLTVFLPREPQQINSYLRTSWEFLSTKTRVKNILDSPVQHQFHSGVLGFIQINNLFLKSAKDYLTKELEVASKVMLEHVQDNFIQEVRWISYHYMLLDGLWSSGMVRKLQGVIRRGSVNLLSLNPLFPPPLTVRTSSSTLPVLLDPCDPSTIDFIMLTYRPEEPLHHFIKESFLLKYNQCFLHLVKIELGRRTLLDSVLFLKNRHVPTPGLQYNQMHVQLQTMNHLITSLKCFLCNSFEKSWDKFSREAYKVSSLDSLHHVHIRFLRDVQHLCFLNKRLSALREVLGRLLCHVYKYCETLRSGVLAENADRHLVHSLYRNLSTQFKLYLVQARRLYSILVRFTESGATDIFSELCELLSVNNFYTSL